MGIEQGITQITVRDDAEEQFFDYGFDGESEITRLYCQTKHKIPNSFTSTCFEFLKNQFECDCLQKNNLLTSSFTCLQLLIGAKQ